MYPVRTEAPPRTAIDWTVARFRSTFDRMGWRDQIGRVMGTVVLMGVVSSAIPARAHFILMQPDAWMSQGPLGDPQKVGPCGNDGGGTPTGKVTAFRSGETIEITINEMIYHPGHYRVALAINDQSELPAAPPVTAVDRDPCGSTVIQDPPVFPVLADNVLPHSGPFDGPQTFSVTLPSDVTCARCTLQIIEYMRNHGQPCFYYHCADISIGTEVATPTATVTPFNMTPSPTATPVDCTGDCDGSGTVVVNEIVTMVNIALERALMNTCAAGNSDGNQQITINEILTAVNGLLGGCAL